MSASKVAPEIRAAALADLLEGDQPAIVAERYGLDRNVVKVWKQRYVTADVTGSPIVKPAVEAQKQHIGELVLDLLRSKLEASAAIAQQASDSAWRFKQSGPELAAFGEWLDATAFAIGDRLAGGRVRSDEDADTSG